MSIIKTIIVFKKELLDLFRDKRTIITSIVVPIALYPLLMIGFNSIMMRQTAILREQDVLIYILDNAGDDYSELIISGLENAETIQIYQKTDHYEALFREKIIQAIVTIDKVHSNNVLSNTGETLQKRSKAVAELEGWNDYPYLDITITYNHVDEKSELAYSNVVEELGELEERMVIGRLHALDISENILKAIEVTRDNVASESQTLGLILSKILPYFLILISISGSAVAAVDLVAGEKERKTLETILVSAAKRNELVVGKFLAVISLSFLTIVLNLLSIFISVRHLLSQAAAEAITIEIPFTNIFLIFILMFPMVVFFSSLLLSLSTYARNMKEAYTYIQPIMIVAMLFSLVSTFPAIENSLIFTLIPIINISLVIRDILVGNFDLYLFLSTFISTIILVTLGIIWSIKLFSNEKILFRTSEETSMFKPKKGDNWAMSHSFAFLFFLAVLLLFYYVGVPWQMNDLETGLIKTLVLLVLLPPLIIINLAKLNYKKVLRLNSTSPWNFLIAILAALPIFLLATFLTQLINYVFPFPANYLEALENMIFLEGRSIWYLLFLIALLPGICEEIMFRGYFIKAFEKKGAAQSIIISGILFGILHLDMYRLIPTTLLGIWMGYLVIKTNSIFIPVLAHTANNALVIIIGHGGENIPYIEYFVEGKYLAWWLVAPALISFWLLLKIFNHLNSNPSIPSQEPINQEPRTNQPRTKH